MRLRILVPVAVLLASTSGLAALATSTDAVAFGAPGNPVFTPYVIPETFDAAHAAGEPTIGIPFNTDHVFFQSFATTYRAVFDNERWMEGAPVVDWSDVTPPFTLTNVDPMIHADTETGRIFAGGLAGPCSLMGISDDDGASWTPALNMCSGAQFDHQSIGSGPWSATAPDSLVRSIAYPRAVYYCAQLLLTACATSVDGGRAWLPFTEVVGPCGGLHGHIAVSEATGFAAVPHGGCAGPEAVSALEAGSFVGFASTQDNGVTWSSRIMPDAPDGNGFDPDIVFSRESGWLWLAQADDAGIHIALSKDEGSSWETLGTGMAGQESATWFNLTATFRDPTTGFPLRFGSFPDLEAGDDDRVALAFLGTTDPAGEHPFDLCSEDNGDEIGPEDRNVWHYYLSQSFDGGATWTTTRLWEDPVQIGAIWNGGGGNPCRNLLDFHDMDMDSTGRLHIALSDGCTKSCAQAYANATAGTGAMPVGEDSRDSWGTILRQTTGLGLLAAYDGTGSPDPAATSTTQPAPSRDSPGLGLSLLLAALAGLALLRRR